MSLSIAALFGIFEGKDILPNIIGVTSVLLSAIFLFAKRKENIKQKLIGLFLVVPSAIDLYYSHFNLFLNERVKISRENSIQVLSGKTSPAINYEKSLNLGDGVKVF